MAVNPIYLLNNAGAATTGAGVECPGLASGASGEAPQALNMPSQATFDVDGVFGTTTMATVQIQRCSSLLGTPDASCNWKDMTDAVFTAPGFLTVQTNATKFRAVVQSGDSGTSLTVTML